MPGLNWEPFLALPGAPDENFEQLCRVLVRRGYGRYGEFRALAQQPGVEFHLKLKDACGLGEPGRWYGWQCRWYDLPSGQSIGSTRRKRIQEAIAKTEQVLPGLTDWVLWTRRPLTKADQEWFYSLTTTTGMNLILWSEAEVEEHLSGESLIYRRTFFGNLVLTSHELSDLHERSIARIRERWDPDLHQVIDAERHIKRKLGQVSAWEDLTAAADRLTEGMTAANTDLKITPSSLRNVGEELIDVAQFLKAAAERAHAALSKGDLDHLADTLTQRPSKPSTKLANLPRQLRSRQNPAVFSFTNLLAEVRSSVRLLDTLDRDVNERQVAVVAEFGCGKTFLAAQLAGSEEGRPAGILLHGSDLSADGNLDGLASKVAIHGNRVSTMESLLAAMDSAGRREHRRLPILIDGLNEAEDPRKWKGLLAELDEILRLYPYALLVTTVRPEFTVETLPPSICQLEIDGFGQDSNDAVTKYFQHYRIEGRDAELPLDLLAHPLTLRLFCEVTNPDRDEMVGVEAMPTSLTALFEKYMDNSAERIAELSPRTHRYYSQDVTSAFLKIGMALWCEDSRSLPLLDLRNLLGDAQRPWNESLVRALEQDGVLLRVSDDMMDDNRVSVVHDALAGHLVANALLVTHGRAGSVDWLNNPDTQTALFGNNAERHPLGSDVVRALVGLVPRRLYGQQLWTFLDDPMRTDALRGAADLEGRYLDVDTINELAVFAARHTPGSREPLSRLWSPRRSGDIFDRLRSTRSSPAHPLNAEFLEMVLGPMQVGERDLRWSEWVRHHETDIMLDLEQIADRWRASEQREESDRLLAIWLKWLLTSTVRHLRDHATLALYWCGRKDPGALFDLTLSSLQTNDPYVPERLLAVSYGVIMAGSGEDSSFETKLAEFLEGLRSAFCGDDATSPTEHWLMREYVDGIVTFARRYYPTTVGLWANDYEFATPERAASVGLDSTFLAGDDPVYGLDFKNYTVGDLVAGRRSYQFDHPDYQEVMSWIRGRVLNLSQTSERFEAVDRNITHTRRRDYIHPDRTEPYVKKYGWIGFFEAAGRLNDEGRLPLTSDGRLSDVTIDPSFPEAPVVPDLIFPDLLSNKTPDIQTWVTQGSVEIPDELFRIDSLGDFPGPWIALSGFIEQEDIESRREVFGILNTILVKRRDAEQLRDALIDREYPGNSWIPQPPGSYYVFAGEMPWSSGPRQGLSSEDLRELYAGAIDVEGGHEIPVEIPVHRFEWESYHSIVNGWGGFPVPAITIAEALDLRAVPNSLNWCDPDGRPASLTASAPPAFKWGHLLYLREDLIRRYCDEHDYELVWIVWGERRPYVADYLDERPDWLYRAYATHSHIWRRVEILGQLAQ